MFIAEQVANKNTEQYLSHLSFDLSVPSRTNKRAGPEEENM